MLLSVPAARIHPGAAGHVRSRQPVLGLADLEFLIPAITAFAEQDLTIICRRQGINRCRVALEVFRFLRRDPLLHDREKELDRNDPSQPVHRKSLSRVQWRSSQIGRGRSRNLNLDVQHSLTAAAAILGERRADRNQRRLVRRTARLSGRLAPTTDGLKCRVTADTITAERLLWRP